MGYFITHTLFHLEGSLILDRRRCPCWFTARVATSFRQTIKDILPKRVGHIARKDQPSTTMKSISHSATLTTRFQNAAWTYFGIIQRKIREPRSLCPIFSKPENVSLSPTPTSQSTCIPQPHAASTTVDRQNSPYNSVLLTVITLNANPTKHATPPHAFGSVYPSPSPLFHTTHK